VPEEQAIIAKKVAELKALLSPFLAKATLDSDFCDLVCRYLAFFSNEFQVTEQPVVTAAPPPTQKTQ